MAKRRYAVYAVIVDNYQVRRGHANFTSRIPSQNKNETLSSNDDSALSHLLHLKWAMCKVPSFRTSHLAMFTLKIGKNITKKEGTCKDKGIIAWGS